jgi:bifunctional UDP-N-acetylglucosamine pyrophosphorylase / glucosamine-1-phosphate N-acetyltransferase
MHTATCVIILAAGEGKRMKSALPKVLHMLDGKPLIDHVVSAVEHTPFAPPLVVVSAEHTFVQDYLLGRVRYAVQDVPRGTGYAVRCAQACVSPDTTQIVVLYGDHPRITSASICGLVAEHEAKKNTMTFALCRLPHFHGPYSVFQSFGRIVRNAQGGVVRNVQVRDASPEEMSITEVDPGIYCFSAQWLWSHVDHLEPKNNQGELYLTDLLGMALAKDPARVSGYALEPEEAFGINSQNDLSVVAELPPIPSL